MGQELDPNDKSSVSFSSNTVLFPSHQCCVNVKNKKAHRNVKCKEDFAEISSCKSLPCRSHILEGTIVKRRGSIYQSSDHQVINMKKMAATIGERKKIEISSRTNSDASFSSSIFYSLCGSDDEDSNENERPSLISQDTELCSQSPSVSGSWPCMDYNTLNGFIELCINSDFCDKRISLVEGVGSVNSKTRSESHLPSPSESDCSSRVSSKVSFTPNRKKVNPFTMSNSLTSPVSYVLEVETTSDVKLVCPKKVVARNMACQKSLLNDFSNTTKHAQNVSEFGNRDIYCSGLASSPVHLHGNLKLENRQGLPYFEFKVKCPEDVFVAKTWRVGNDFNWVYTFHSFDNQRCDKGSSSMVAQMLVSYNLCSELEDGVFGNFMGAEFVLYDFTHSRKSVPPKIKSYRKQDASKTLNGSSLESAAIVLRVPFHKRESLKHKKGDRISAKTYSKPSVISSAVQKNRKNIHESKVQEQVKVVLPIGNHGLPSGESRGPSSLLDRWKHGGGCDCGGWDMACPLILLGNPCIRFDEGRPLADKYQPLELFSQGTKENIPTFGMTLVEEGQYAVDFHAKLSPLQAFSISVAILHGTSAFSPTTRQAKNQQLSQCNSPNTLIEEEVELFIKSVTTEEKKAVSNIPKGLPRSCIPKPPFSPIARV
ncbi:uncharacterized protein [Cicer arietinum]|uniref:Uncharacterized protein LOC113788018 n=1 Tax=Cicer arietinum TaxID=3827 RepID=A0A3Q7YGZ2_CICAR|nr:uncharacterized protein LOC113788018 [Cicer arietinum]XP_027193085.1 uncharacterized protein LOC113788018 [Cicer arietinum]